MRISLLVLCLSAAVFSHAQLLSPATLDSVETFHSMERALQDPDKVYRLDLSSKKLKEVPEDIRKFRNLNALDLGTNKLRTLPAWLADLAYLQELRVSRNKLVEYPTCICKLKHLKRLDLSRNALTGLPKCMGGMKELVSLDLWDNDLADFPEEIEGMEALRFMDLRAIQFEVPEMERIQELLPRAKVHFSPPCNCGM
jgi:leucine-rich repeat protein SHOC2